ncbi:unannotated protein [freshwater metagenome]|uniref:Unannotated protein n=1 Tax=freshwater metagenome TaxID=449393 RepID=A0A6J7DTN9_9ZZZZ|nr:hypothetical protein [Actinomycetota bacterium]
MTSPSLALKISVFAHVSAQPQALAEVFNGAVASSVDSEIDLAIFAINPAAGIDQMTIDLWHQVSEYQIPRLLLVVGLDGSEIDFDDAVLVANRVLDPVVTPYLVLHGDNGEPAALISLSDMKIRDYSTTPPTIRESESEHQEIISDFRHEYLEALQEMGEDAFAAGLLFPAIPIVLGKNIGVDIAGQYINQLSS